MGYAVTADTDGKEYYQIIKMLEEVFNLLNICNHANNAIADFIKIGHSIYDDLPDIQIISLPSITAGKKICVHHSSDYINFTSLFQPPKLWHQFLLWLK